MNDCSNCAVLQTEVNRLRLENKRLAERVKKLTFAIAQILKACEQVQDYAERIMAQHQPRGKWSFAKGAGKVAGAIATLAHHLAA